MRVVEMLRQRRAKRGGLSLAHRELLQAEYVIERYEGRPIKDREDYEGKLAEYLRLAINNGLVSESHVMACRDMAVAQTDPDGSNYVDLLRWNTRRDEALSNDRGPRVIDMRLYPPFFEAILHGRKTFEGRAYDSVSPKNYPDIRTGDTIEFSIYTKGEPPLSIYQSYGLRPDSKMEVSIGEVLFGPTVAHVFQQCPMKGKEFQPDITVRDEVFRLESIATYYSFPNYPGRIDREGFVGIEVLNPRLVR